MSGDANFLALKRRVVTMANNQRERMTGDPTADFALIMRAVNDPDIDVVYAVWTDFREPDGYGILIVKGANFLRRIAESGHERNQRFTAFPCKDQVQAVALHNKIGEVYLRH